MNLDPHTIVTQARTWKGTRFAHQGRLKKSIHHRGGVDCLGLLVGVARELGLDVASYDVTDYGHLPDTEQLHEGLLAVLESVDQRELQVGDVALMVVDTRAQHLGIITDYPEPGEFGLIHAYAPARAVVEHRLDEAWRRAIISVFRILS